MAGTAPMPSSISTMPSGRELAARIAGTIACVRTGIDNPAADVVASDLVLDAAGIRFRLRDAVGRAVVAGAVDLADCFDGGEPAGRDRGAGRPGRRISTPSSAPCATSLRSADACIDWALVGDLVDGRPFLLIALRERRASAGAPAGAAA
ncbi:hypothetical protein PEC18_37670 [Paucibacter sp. O1-1]|nr:hypothetical protein [Paucibacter sp. O1-1]MDA3831364.1 hypothetical protein [Paucibacter sp. O1-1]